MSKIMLGLCLVIACLPSLAAADEWGNVVALSKNLKAGGKFVEARKILLAALDDAPLSATRIAVAYSELGTIAQDQGKYTEAERLYRLSIQQWELVPGHLGIARTMNNLASLLFVVGKTDAADVWLRRAETLQIQAMGTDHPETARLYQNRATLYLRFQQYKKAEVEYRKALEVWEKSGPAYELEIASDARGLAIICRQTSRSAEAVGYNERARAIWERQVNSGYASPEVRTALAKLYFEQRKPLLAEPVLKEAIRQSEMQAEPDYPFLASILKMYAKICRQNGRKAEAREMEQRLQKIESSCSQACQSQQTIAASDLMAGAQSRSR